MTDPDPSEQRSLLELSGIDAGYGSFRALFDVDLRLGVGTATALVGANGAGKSTVARVASGLVEPSAGIVSVDGEDLTGRPPHIFANAGIAHAPEGRALFGTLTVEENLTLAFRNAPEISDYRKAMEVAFELFPKLGDRRSQNAGTLSGGEQRMLTLARVMVAKPKLLIADELSLGLAPLVTAQVYEALARIRDSGCALLIVEQHLDHALELADHVAVIEKGEITFQGPPGEAAKISETLLLPPRHPAKADEEVGT